MPDVSKQHSMADDFSILRNYAFDGIGNAALDRIEEQLEAELLGEKLTLSTSAVRNEADVGTVSEVSKPHSELRESLAVAIEDVLLIDSPEGDSPRNIAANLRDVLIGLDSLEEQLEAQQRLLFVADAAYKWIAQEYPKVIREMPPNLYRELKDARVPFPAKRPK